MLIQEAQLGFQFLSSQMNIMTSKKCLFVALLLITLTSINAQQVSFGVKGGVNFSNINATRAIDQLTPDFSDIIALNFGGVAEIAFNDQFAVQAELLFQQKGFGVQQGVDVNLFNIPLPLGVTAETRINYLDIPLLAKVKFGNEQFNGFLTAGPTFGYATGGRLLTKANVILDLTLVNTPINLDAINFKRFEVGGAVGGGLSFDSDFGELFIEARYNHGFTELYDIPLVNERLRNRNISLSAGVLIPIN